MSVIFLVGSDILHTSCDRHGLPTSCGGNDVTHLASTESTPGEMAHHPYHALQRRRKSYRKRREKNETRILNSFTKQSADGCQKHLLCALGSFIPMSLSQQALPYCDHSAMCTIWHDITSVTHMAMQCCGSVCSLFSDEHNVQIYYIDRYILGIHARCP